MKKNNILISASVTIFAAASALGDDTIGNDTNVPGNLIVTGTGSFNGNALYLGTLTGTSGSKPGMVFSYLTTGGTSMFTLGASSAHQTWLWGNSLDSTGVFPMMQLDDSNRLTLFNPNTKTASIVLDPSTAQISANGSPLITQQNADQRYLVLSSGNGIVLSGTSFTMPNQTIGGAGSVLTRALADQRYASSAAITLGSVTSPYGGPAGPTIALPGGSATGAYSLAGISAHASGFGSVASGFDATASGLGATASGFYSTASGQGATASGFYSTASGNYSTSAGFFTISSGCNQFAIGQYNVSQGNSSGWVANDDLFIIGNGTDPGHPSDAFVVKKNGNTTINGVLTVSGGLLVSGTAVTSETGTVIVAKANQLVLIPQQGDLSMGGFTAGARPQ